MPTHFTPESIKFLRGLARHNDREWFGPRKPIYERSLKAPMLALIEEINHAMEGFAPQHVQPPHKAMMRIYRDTRFSSDKRPYKTQIAAWWSRRGMEKTSGGGFYLHIRPEQVMVAAGVYMPQREQLLAIREWMAGHHEQYRSMLNSMLKPRGKAVRMDAIESQALTRMPKGFAADHPADELLRARNWGVRATLPAELALEPSLAREIVKRFKLAAPLVEALNKSVLRADGGGRERPLALF
jgi:uncharacterized protein (TIGR02453 family)